MFVGHGLFAFVLLAAIGRLAGWSRERTLHLAVLAAAFATLPDIDIIYAPVGLLGATSGVFDAATAFWQTGNVVHRVLTHSVVLAPVVAVVAGLWSVRSTASTRSRSRGATVAALTVAGGIVAVSTAFSGGLGGVIVAAFVLGALAIAQVASRYGVRPLEIVAVATVALVSHPFGDVFTGEPPATFYPLDIVVFTERVTLHPDPTLHLLAAFFIELGIVWLAVLAYHDLRGRGVRNSVSPRAAVGTGYAIAALTIPAPTLASSYHFVFSVLAVGLVGPLEVRPGRTRQTVTDGGSETHDRLRRLGLCDRLTAGVTALSAITLAALGYTGAYLIL